MKILICIPTYNEVENVGLLAEGIFRVLGDRADILFIDDASPDGTGRLLDALAQKDKRIHVLHRSGKLGLATAYIEGFRWGLERSYSWFFEMDADFSHDPAHLSDFLEQIDSGHWDVVCGSRYVEGGGVSNWSAARELLSRMGSVYSNFCLRYPLKDWTGGFNAWSRSVLLSLELSTIRSKGYAFQIEMKYRALLLGHRLVEVPIIFRERRAGQSKMSGSIVKEAVWAVVVLRWRAISSSLFT